MHTNHHHKLALNNDTNIRGLHFIHHYDYLGIDKKSEIGHLEMRDKIKRK